MVTENESVLFQIARRVRQLREDSGLSQDAFARLVPCHRSQVSQVERGVNNLSLDTIERFAIALGVDAVSLLQEGAAIARNPRDFQSATRARSEKCSPAQDSKGAGTGCAI